MNEQITLKRTCDVLEIPSGLRQLLQTGTVVRISQSSGDSYTVTTGHGNLYRVEGKDADALGFPAPQSSSAALTGEFSEEAVWNELRTVFDPEIPVNIVDLGLIYSCANTPLEEGARRLEITMTLTAPGCGMANVIKADVERKLSHLPGVKEVSVEVVFEPPWNPSRMSEAAKLQLGFDLDFGSSSPMLPILNPRK
jgi:probable FeS assembly SUF system protein SufT